MALNKRIPTAYGVDLCYWKVTRLNLDWLHEIGEVFLGGWPSQQSRLDGDEPMEYKAIEFRHNEWPFTVDGYNITEAYECLKLPIIDPASQMDSNPFTGSTDVYEPGQPGERP